MWLWVGSADDREGGLFTVTVHRKEAAAMEVEGSSEIGSEKILGLLKANPKLAAREVAETLGITPRAVEKQIARLRTEGRLRRVGPDRGGYWGVVE